MNQDFMVKFDSDGNCRSLEQCDNYEDYAPKMEVESYECESDSSEETYTNDYSFESCYCEKEYECNDEIEDKECDTHKKSSKRNRREKCKRAYDRGYREGYEAGKCEGFECGVTEGFRKGVQAGIARVYREIMMKSRCKNRRMNRGNFRYY